MKKFSYANVTKVLARSAFIEIIAVGMTFVITSGGPDLSVGATAAFVAGLMILAMNCLVPILGGGVGSVLVGVGRIEAFIVTLGTMGIYCSLATWLADCGRNHRSIYPGGHAWLARGLE